MNSLSQEWEKVASDNKMMRMQLDIAEKELNKLRDIEHTLFRTLKTAEDTSSQITDQANKAAEVYLVEAQQKSEKMVEEATLKASLILQEAESKSKFIQEDIISELKNQERDFRAMEKYRDNLIVQLKTLVNNTSETVGRFEEKFSKESFELRISSIQNHIIEVTKEAGISENIELSIESSKGEEPLSEVEVQVFSDPEVTSEVIEEQEPEEVVVLEEEKVEITSEEDLVEELELPASEESLTVPDAASEAIAEAERTAKAVRDAAESIRKSEAKAVEQAREEPKTGGSFFDQIR